MIYRWTCTTHPTTHTLRPQAFSVGSTTVFKARSHIFKLNFGNPICLVGSILINVHSLLWVPESGFREVVILHPLYSLVVSSDLPLSLPYRSRHVLCPSFSYVLPVCYLLIQLNLPFLYLRSFTFRYQ